MMKLKYAYGWVTDIPDQRDYLYNAIRPVVRLSKEVDLRGLCSTVEDQGLLGSCTAKALAGNLEFIDNKIDSAYTDVSRLFIYYNETWLSQLLSLRAKRSNLSDEIASSLRSSQ